MKESPHDPRIMDSSMARFAQQNIVSTVFIEISLQRAILSTIRFQTTTRWLVFIIFGSRIFIPSIWDPFSPIRVGSTTWTVDGKGTNCIFSICAKKNKTNRVNLLFCSAHEDETRPRQYMQSVYPLTVYIHQPYILPHLQGGSNNNKQKKIFAEKCLHSIIGKPKRKYEFPLYSCHEAHNISSAPQSGFGSHQSNCRNKTRMFDLFIDRFTFPLIISHRPT